MKEAEEQFWDIHVSFSMYKISGFPFDACSTRHVSILLCSKREGKVRSRHVHICKFIIQRYLYCSHDQVKDLLLFLSLPLDQIG